MFRFRKGVSEPERVPVRALSRCGKAAMLCGVIAAALCALAVFAPFQGTAAYTSMTANANENAFTEGNVAVCIVENGNPVEGAGSATFGVDAKHVKVRSTGRSPAVVRVSLYPDVMRPGAEGTRSFASQNWGKPESNTMKTGLLTLVLKDGWEQGWTYCDGTFYCKRVVASGEETPELLQGVVLSDGVSADAVGSAKGVVIAEAVRSFPSEAPGEWGCTVADDGTVSVS